MLNFMIDVQALQTDSRLRGIGRSLSEILEKTPPPVLSTTWLL